MTRIPMRTKSRETDIGFCSACRIIREDYEGVPITDCVCTAKINHKENCMYIKAVAMWVSMELYCKKHNLDPCEECDCTCKTQCP
jgi:hypothetical protein